MRGAVGRGGPPPSPLPLSPLIGDRAEALAGWLNLTNWTDYAKLEPWQDGLPTSQEEFFNTTGETL